MNSNSENHELPWLQFFDPHINVKILSHMEEQNIFDKSKLANYKLNELKKTRKFEMIEDLLNALKLNSNNHKAILEKEKT